MPSDNELNYKPLSQEKETGTIAAAVELLSAVGDLSFDGIVDALNHMQNATTKQTSQLPEIAVSNPAIRDLSKTLGQFSFSGNLSPFSIQATWKTEF